MIDLKRTKKGLISLAMLMAIIGTGCNDSDSASSQESDSQRVPTNFVSNRPKLSIQVRNDKKDRAKKIADLVFTKPTDENGPRVAEIFLKYSNGLKYLSSTAGSALDESKKTLVAQNSEDNKVRLVIYGADNANNIDGGILATVEFESETTDLNTLEILTTRPIFAPGVVNDGLLVADPVTFE